MMTEIPGIVLDLSHGSAADLDLAVIWYAKQMGWDGGQNDIGQLLDDYDFYTDGRTPDDYTDEEDFIFSFREALTFACDDAVEWLNDNRQDDDHFYVIDDNSLYYWKDNGEDF